jgi:hypothetical protein
MPRFFESGEPGPALGLVGGDSLLHLIVTRFRRRNKCQGQSVATRIFQSEAALPAPAAAADED